MRRFWPWLLSALMLTSLLAGTVVPAARADVSAPKSPRVLRVQLPIEPGAIDSAAADTDEQLVVLRQVMEGLIRPDAHGGIAKGSGAAADWTISPDGLTYTFTLKDGLLWSDGKPVIAGDFAYSWLRALDPSRGASFSYLFDDIQGAQAWNELDPKAADFAARSSALKAAVGIQALDDKTLQITLARPTASFLTVVGHPVFSPVRQDLVEKYGANYGSGPRMLATNGPFKLTGWSVGEELVLTKNPIYWDADQVALDEVHLRIVRDSAQAFSAYTANQLDIMSLPRSWANAYVYTPGFYGQLSPTTWYISLNTGDASKPYLQNVHVRHALSLALDRVAFVNTVAEGDLLPAIGIVPPGVSVQGIPYREQAGALVSPRAQVDAAQAELAQGLQELGLTQLPPISLLTSGKTGTSYAQTLAALLQQHLPVSVTVTAVPFGERLMRQRRGQFDLSLEGWLGDYDDPVTFLDLWTSASLYNDVHWQNAAYDRLLADAATVVDPAKRWVVLKQAEQLLLLEAPVIPVYTPMLLGLQKPWVLGVTAVTGDIALDLKRASRATVINLTLTVDSRQANVNGKVKLMPVAPTLLNGITMVPLRYIGESLGAQVTYQQDGHIEYHLGDTAIQLQIGNPQAVVNGQNMTLAAPPQIVDGRALVPLRFVSEALGAHLGWDGITRRITITQAAP